MNRKAVVFAPFISFEASTSRPLFVAQTLACSRIVDVVTTDFDHQLKTRREARQYPWLRRIIYIRTPAYSTNTSPARFLSHIVFSVRVARFFLRNHREYDIVYITVPLNLVAFLVFVLCRGQKKIIDIVDIWPDVLPIAPFIRKAFLPVFLIWKKLFTKSVNRADLLMAVSDRFLAEGLRYFLKDRENARRFYIGQSAFSAGTEIKEKLLTITYLGNIGQLYDFETLIEVLAGGDLVGMVQLFIIGDGDRRPWLLSELEKRNIPFVYYGILYEADKLASVLRRSHVGFNGYRNTLAAFSYKAVSYFAAGLPILNSMSGDLWQLVDKYRLGVNYDENNSVSLKNALLQCNSAYINEMACNCKRFFSKELENSALQKDMLSFLGDHI